jgi:hypothetical protein
VTASWTTLNYEASAPSDFVAASGSVTFQPGAISSTVTVTINGDTLNEPTERMLVSFKNPVNARIGGIWGLGIVTIVDDDPPQETTPQALCASSGGIYGNTNMTAGSWPTILWTCNDWFFTSNDNFQAKSASLGGSCLEGGGTGYAVRSVDATARAYFTCGKG